MLDYIPLTIVISLVEEHINIQKQTIIKDSNKKWKFIKNLSKFLRKIDTSDIVNFLYLNRIVNNFVSVVENT